MGSGFRKVTDDFWVAGQIDPRDVVEAAEGGFATILNNRPEGESFDQPAGSEIAAAAEAAGLDYVAAPIQGRPGALQIEEMMAIMEASKGPVLAYCRSGMRSVAAWALGQAASGKMTREQILTAARNAGYDLSMIL